MLPHTIPAGAEELTISNVATTLEDYIKAAATSGNWNPSPKVNTFQIQVKTNSIRYSSCFTPTTTNGMLITTGNAMETIKQPLDSITLIRNGSSDATITVQIFEDNKYTN